MPVVVHHSHTLDIKMVCYRIFPANEETNVWPSDPINGSILILILVLLVPYLFCGDFATPHRNGVKHIAHQERCKTLSGEKLTKRFPLKGYSQRNTHRGSHANLSPSYCCGCCSYSAQNWRNFIIFLLSSSDTALVENRSVREQGTC